VPSLGLKSSVLAAVGLGGGSAGGGLAAGLGTAGSASLGSGALAKVALVGVLAGGGAVAGKTAIDEPGRPRDARPPAPAQIVERPSAATSDRLPAAPQTVRHTPSSRAPEAESRRRRAVAPPGIEKRAEQGATVPSPPDERPGPGTWPPGRTKPQAVPPGQLPEPAAPGRGQSPPAPQVDGAPQGNGRGPIEAPPAETPVKRGPLEPKPKPAAVRPAEAKLKPRPPATHAETEPAAKPAPAADKAQGPANGHEPGSGSAKDR
jgi:hypothetical protein